MRQSTDPPPSPPSIIITGISSSKYRFLCAARGVHARPLPSKTPNRPGSIPQSGLCSFLSSPPPSSSTFIHIRTFRRHFQGVGECRVYPLIRFRLAHYRKSSHHRRYPIVKGFDNRRRNDADDDKVVPDGEEAQEKEAGKKLLSRVQKEV
ncbi:hypothetical protein [Absidia glauca]|uniref:Uncharacterized protein n=1 Tax=Absidia glauca TaxID=4829 RepID=A0A168LP50_ABSGL|nr:hypothetical protein [Absidia glauca]